VLSRESKKEKDGNVYKDSWSLNCDFNLVALKNTKQQYYSFFCYIPFICLNGVVSGRGVLISTMIS
jgi:hypothetical protein